MSCVVYNVKIMSIHCICLSNSWGEISNYCIIQSSTGGKIISDISVLVVTLCGQSHVAVGPFKALELPTRDIMCILTALYMYICTWFGVIWFNVYYHWFLIIPPPNEDGWVILDLSCFPDDLLFRNTQIHTTGIGTVVKVFRYLWSKSKSYRSVESHNKTQHKFHREYHFLNEPYFQESVLWHDYR